jgi:Flp pilus assembly protein TadD
LVSLAVPTVSWAGDPARKQASEQVKRGYQAAREGYWLEALYRFERADTLTPNQPRILNNIAVALEASGRFEEALVAYQTALEVAPNDRVLRRNFGQFKEFYDAQVAVAEPEGDEADDSGDESAPDAGDGKESEDG